MPYIAANDLQDYHPGLAFLKARDDARKNALFEQQAASNEATAQAQRQNMLFQQQRLTQQDQVTADERGKSQEHDDGLKLNAYAQRLAQAKTDEEFNFYADRMAQSPLLQKYGIPREKITPQAVQQILGMTGAELGQAPADQFEQVSGPRGSVIAKNSRTGEIKQVVGPDNSQPRPEAAINPESVESTAQMIANNQIPMLSGYALKSPWGQAVVGRVRDLNPQYAGADYGSNAAALKQFTSGKNGNTVRSLNVAVQHLDQLGALAQALSNGDVPAINRISNWWKTNTGQAAPTNFNAGKKLVADEIVKAIVGSGGGVADREEASKSINAAGSPAQLAQVIETYQGLLTGQLNGLRQQYQTATGRDNFETLLLPETRSKLEAHGAQSNASTAPVKVASPADAAKLSSGTRFVTPDGQVRTRR